MSAVVAIVDDVVGAASLFAGFVVCVAGEFLAGEACTARELVTVVAR
ncbi:MAG TPA: hypothetical protein VD971_07730 [Phycisphaerales bacterium]|nr:hypothetical protein [Phycisphaerales bacterium]